MAASDIISDFQEKEAVLTTGSMQENDLFKEKQRFLKVV